ncbi:MAG: recombinase family protein [Oscillospiraceae bacterium]|nr:recombinase family protein [Oscillospiraceae bacterium]
MAQNRYLPYGYKIENGKTGIEPQEAEIIRSIYKQYASGLSYLKIAEGLSDLGVRYMPDKPLWNKNMVARILQNKNYLGTEKYPAIIECTLEQKARQMAKPYTHTEPNEIKAIKPLLQCGICGQPLKRRLKASGTERWYCPTDTGHIAISVTDESILREISTLQTHSSETAVLPQDSPSPHAAVSTQAIRLQNEIDRLLEQTPLDAKEIQSKISELAAERYSLCETANHIQDAFIPHHRIEQLAKCVASIQISHNKVIALILKNGKIIKEGDVPNE